MAVRYSNPTTQYFDDNGNVLSGGLLYFYQTSTTTPKNTFSDNALSVPNTNPVVLDAFGRTPSIFLNGSYRSILKDSTGTQIWDRDFVNSTSGGAFENWDPSISYSINDIVYASDANYYISLVSSNLANEPSVSPTEWKEIQLLGAEGFTLAWQSVADTGYLTLDPPAFTADTTENTHRAAFLATSPITIPAGTTPLVSSVYVVEPNITATGTVTKAATVYIKDAPTEGATNYAVWIDSGNVQIDDSLTVGGALTGTTGTFTGVVNAADGTASAPGFGFSSNTNMGIFLGSEAALNENDLVSFSIEGSERIGIGRWNSLDTDIAGLITGSASGAIILAPETSNLTVALRENGADDGFQIISGGGNWTSDNIWGKLCFEVKANGDTTIGGDLTALGDVTIEKDNPSLRITDTASASPEIILERSSGSDYKISNDSGIFRIDQGTDGITFGNDIYYATSTTQRFYISNTEVMRVESGGLGIGTSGAPLCSLEVETTDQFTPTSANTTAGIVVTQKNGTDGTGTYGSGVTLTKISSTRPGCAVVAKQITTNNNQIGMAFFCHESGIASDTLVEQMTLSHLGDLSVTGNFSGNGIDFDASSTVLDDYEEGTWNPTLTTDGTDFDSVTYDPTRGGQYVKVGDLVHIQGYVLTDAVTVGSASGNVVFGGLPFNSVASTGSTLDGRGNIGFSYSNVWGHANVPRYGYTNPGGSTITLMYDRNGGFVVYTSVSTLANRNRSTFGGTYRSA